MLDLQKYTKMCQIGDHIKALESMDMDKSPKSYAQMLKKYQLQYGKLKQELFDERDFDSNIDLKLYISECLKILNKNIIEGQPKWQYYLDEVSYNNTVVPDFYGDHIYHHYIYQVVFVCGDKEIPFCTVNRKLNYGDKMGTINFLTEEMHAPFSLRLDNECDEFDSQTIKELKKAPFKVVYKQKLNKEQKDMTLIQQRITELQVQYNDKHSEYLDCLEQLDKLDKEEIFNKN